MILYDKSNRMQYAFNWDVISSVKLLI